MPANDVLERLERIGANPSPGEEAPRLLVLDATSDPARVAQHRRLRARAFVDRQAMFTGHDRDEHDSTARTRVLVALDRDGVTVGGVRLHPARPGAEGLGWWQGSRLVCRPGASVARGEIGAALVRAACARAVNEGALRFDAHVQAAYEPFFARLGWTPVRAIEVRGRPHVLMRWPIERIAELARATKQPLGSLVGRLLASAPGMGAWLGDDGAPVGGTGVVACTDAIAPAMVERDPEWAGWCGILVTAHDLAAMGASPLGALDAVGARDRATAERLISGLRRGADALALPVLGGHTQLGVPGTLSVTGLGHARHPVPAGGGRVGDELTVTADLGGGWRPGYAGRQWDSSTHRRREELRAMLDSVALARPRAAKDVSMAGLAGTVGMLAEAGGCGAELNVERIPRPAGASGGDWLTCFPGFVMVTADAPGAPPPPAGPASSAACGVLTGEPGVRLRWPDGDVTTALTGGVTGLGQAIGETA